MDWTLDPTGNWPGYLTKTAGTTDLNQARTSNKVNEITNITEATGPTWVTPAYDTAGNTTTMPQVADPTLGFTATYDAWNRMTGISASGTTVAKYQYDGRNRRIVKLTYAGGSLSETRHFYFTNAWQAVEERVGTSTSMDKQRVWGIRYVDELVCRDDATPQRLYACQDANFNVTSITDTSGVVQERYLFDPYGSRTIMTASWGVITSSAYVWVIGYQGLIHDSESWLVHARNRYLAPQLGVWSSRDFLGYLNSPNLYEFVRSSPIGVVDPLGLDGFPFGGIGPSMPAIIPPYSWSGPSTPPTTPPSSTPPTTGPIPPPQPFGFWNDPSRQPINNCYNYACDRPADGGNIPNFWQPGKTHGFPPFTPGPGGNLTCDDVLQRVQADGGVSPDAGGNCPACYHKIRVWVDPGVDFHFYREGPGGNWTDKPGSTPAKPVTDPNVYHHDHDYQKCGDLCVKN